MSSGISSDQILRALARELKTPLITIARQAELSGDEYISSQASDIMALIDGYLMTAQTEYGQVPLPLQATGIGSVLYDVTQDVRPLALANNVFVNAWADHDGAVMTHRKGLQVALGCLTQLAIAGCEPNNKVRSEVQVVSYQRRNGSMVAGVISPDFALTPRDLKRAEVLYGDSHMALSTQLPGSGIRLAIAQQIAEALGAQIITLRRRGLRGLGFELIKSEQLRLV